ncbi:MAG: SAM-dependent DNA methyltransferase [Oscillospiraceae bacterium]|nr:SAM-dependent DNA methyltransferase [Oscillospiraceae bacterium]
MITGELKNRIDSLWDIFAAGGLVNPLDVIEQITYLMFIRDMDDADNRRAKESEMLGLPHKSIFADEVQIGERTVAGNQLKWSVFHDFPAEKMYSVMQEQVFPFIKNLHGDKNSAYSKYMSDAIFKLPTPLLLSKVVDCLDDIYAQMAQIQESDIRGDVYEYLLSKISQSGLNGQFRTPRHIIKMMVELMQPKATDTICDPACGTSGFLVAAGEYLKENHKEEIFFEKQNKEHYMNSMFHGYDMDRTMLRIGAMNMMTHGVDNPCIEYRDSLSDQNPDKEKYSLILANPPFKGSLDADTVSADLLKVCKTKKTELLFLALFLRMLKVGGRGAVIVPDGVLFGSSTAHKAIRKELVDGNRLEAVISMPSGVFKPYAGVSTGILIFTKTGHGGTDKVWFYDMQADGFTLDDKRTPTTENDIPDIIARFHSIQSLPLEGKVDSESCSDEVYNEHENPRTAKSFFVPKEEIVENGYDLSINKYKKIEYKPVEYPSTQEIMAELNELEMEITKGLAELEEML